MNADTLPESTLRYMSKADRDSIGKTARLQSEIAVVNAVAVEKALHNLLMQYFQLNEIFYIHSQFGKKTRSTVGVPDFCFAINGQAIAIECKTADGVLSKDQEKAIARMRANGWAIEVCTSLAQAIIFINKFK